MDLELDIVHFSKLLLWQPLMGSINEGLEIILIFEVSKRHNANCYNGRDFFQIMNVERRGDHKNPFPFLLKWRIPYVLTDIASTAYGNLRGNCAEIAFKHNQIPIFVFSLNIPSLIKSGKRERQN